jgi:hypothetical protein
MPIVGANCARKNSKHELRSSLKKHCLENRKIAFPVFPQPYAQRRSNGFEATKVPANQQIILTSKQRVPHVGCRREVRMSDVVAYVDGGSMGNPGPSGIGVVLDSSEGRTIRIAKWIGRQDNNVAEYVALLEALQCALTLKATKAARLFRL